MTNQNYLQAFQTLFRSLKSPSIVTKNRFSWKKISRDCECVCVLYSLNSMQSRKGKRKKSTFLLENFSWDQFTDSCMIRSTKRSFHGFFLWKIIVCQKIQCGENDKFTLTEEIFRQINSLVISSKYVAFTKFLSKKC